jgi:hypothetical protein
VRRFGGAGVLLPGSRFGFAFGFGFAFAFGFAFGFGVRVRVPATDRRVRRAL